MSKKINQIIKIMFGAAVLFFVSVVLYFVPPIHEKLAWRVDNLRLSIIYFFDPPQKVTFHPTEQLLPTPTLGQPAATATVTPTQLPTGLVTPTVTPTPPPSSVILTNVLFIDQMGRYNFCGPANLAMALKYWGWTGDPDQPLLELRDQIGAVVKPGENDTSKSFVERSLSDVNVMPYELVDYTNEHTSLKALFRYGGDADLLKRLIAAGFPPITEKGLYEPLRPDNSVQWGGHYSFTTGYDDTKQEFVWQDSYLPPSKPVGKDSRTSYAEYLTNWRAFDYVFIVVYPPDREQELYQVLGPWSDQYWATQHALDIANQEIASQKLDGNDLFFAMFNKVTSLVYLENPDYGQAAAAYDQANAYYNTLPQNKLIPWRIMWYQTAPYFAYYYSGRYQDVINLATNYLTKLSIAPTGLEESVFWLSRAEYALGEYDQAYTDMRTALYYHPGFQPALDMFTLWGVSP